MVVTRDIGTYKVLLLDWQAESDSGHAGFVYFYAPSGAYLGYVCGIKAGKRLPDTVRLENGIVHIYVPETEMLELIDVLQDERDVQMRFDAIHGQGAVERFRAEPEMAAAHIVEPSGALRGDAVQARLTD